MKDFLITNYKFNKGTIGAGYIELNINNFRIDRLISVINQTRGVVLYATGSPTLKFNSVIDNKVYFGVDTSTFDDSDILQIVYNSDQPLNVVANDTDETLLMLKKLLYNLQGLANIDASTGSVKTYISGSGASINTAVTSLPTTPIDTKVYNLESYAYLQYISKIAFTSLRNNII